MYNYELKRSKRKTVSLEITADCNVLVRAPMKMSKAFIDEFVQKHNEWIKNALERQSKKLRNQVQLDDEKIKALKEQAKEYIPKRVSYYSGIMGLLPKSVKITSAKTRFGSCSGENALCFSYLLMLYPKEAIDYVVVHELAHIKHHNHSKAFYELIEKYLPDYKERIKLLKNF